MRYARSTTKRRRKQRDQNVSGNDAFACSYAAVEADMESALLIRRTKARLLEEVPKLQRMAVKEVKEISTEELAARNDLVLALPDRIQSIPDGTAAPKTAGDQGSDMISEGSDTLKNMAHDMNEELDKQVPLMDEIDAKADKAAAELTDTVAQCSEGVK